MKPELIIIGLFVGVGLLIFTTVLVYYKMGWNFNPPPEKTDKAILILIILFLLLQTDGIV